MGAEPKLEGKSCNVSYLNLFSFGNSRIETAKKNGNIQKIAFVNRESLSISGILFYRKFIVVWVE
ncbi:TRL domain-containing protein [Leptospira sp. WS4.C2]